VALPGPPGCKMCIWDGGVWGAIGAAQRKEASLGRAEVLAERVMGVPPACDNMEALGEPHLLNPG
jgi:hypothetical protein